MELYTLYDMDTDFNERISNVPHSADYLYFSDPYHAFFYLLNGYGFRFNELQKCSLFTRIDATNIRVPLSKGQYYRFITNSEENIDNLLTSLAYYDYFRYVNNSTASELLQRLLQKKMYLDTGKSITTHYFRHKLCKIWNANGATLQTIAEYIGEINLANIAGYVNSTIYYTPYMV